MLDAALRAFDDGERPGVPTWLGDGERFWGTARVDWLVARMSERPGAPA